MPLSLNAPFFENAPFFAHPISRQRIYLKIWRVFLTKKEEMDVFQRKKLNVINFTCEEISFIEKVSFEKVTVY